MSGSDSFRGLLGDYTAVVKNGRADVTWDLDDAEDPALAWGAEMLKEIMAWNEEHGTLTLYAEKAAALTGGTEKDAEDTEPQADMSWRERDTAAAKAAAILSEEEMATLARSAIVLRYGLTDAEAELLERYIPSYDPEVMYLMLDGKPCFQVEYLLELDENDPRAALNGAYTVTVNVENGAIEDAEEALMRAGISEHTLEPVAPEKRGEARAAILKNMILALASL